jgi:hypothetical protein
VEQVTWREFVDAVERQMVEQGWPIEKSIAIDYIDMSTARGDRVVVCIRPGVVNPGPDDPMTLAIVDD